MRRLFAVVFLLLVYGSFYPWTFHFGGLPLSGAVLNVFRQWPQQWTFAILKDMALNIVVYAPLGLTGYLSMARGFRWRRAVAPVLVGFTLSLTVESLQVYLPRSPSLTDLICNTLGTAGGVIIAAAYESALSRWLERLNRNTMRPSSALMMLIIFASHYLLPLSTNTIKLFSVYHHPTIDQHWDRSELINTMFGWLFAGRFAEAVAGNRRWAFPALLAALGIAGVTRILSPNLLFTWPMLAGAAAGFALWKLLEGRGVERIYAALAFAWVVGDGLRPYQFNAHNQFDWIPFYGMLSLDWMQAMTTLMLKTWMYGTVFWAWERAGLARPRALAALMIVLSLIEFAQLYLPGRTSTMTDLAMGLIAASLLWSVERKYGA